MSSSGIVFGTIFDRLRRGWNVPADVVLECTTLTQAIHLRDEYELEMVAYDRPTMGRRLYRHWSIPISTTALDHAMRQRDMAGVVELVTTALNYLRAMVLPAPRPKAWRLFFRGGSSHLWS